ncbi:MAG: R3H domain-containing nucleic acid-binding protein [Candidatus Daviesbacteria bacterium]
MESKVSEILENILGLLNLEGSFEVVEEEDQVRVSVESNDPGRLIGFRGETLDALQLIVNLILSRQLKEGEAFKRVVIDVSGWRQNKEADLNKRAIEWISEVKETGKELELEPMPSWQRRIIHIAVGENSEVESESIGEGRERHLVIRPVVVKSKAAKKTKTSKKEPKEPKELKDSKETISEE